jgi:hypothetical protein
MIELASESVRVYECHKKKTKLSPEGQGDAKGLSLRIVFIFWDFVKKEEVGGAGSRQRGAKNDLVSLRQYKGNNCQFLALFDICTSLLIGVGRKEASLEDTSPVVAIPTRYNCTPLSLLPPLS